MSCGQADLLPQLAAGAVECVPPVASEHHALQNTQGALTYSQVAGGVQTPASVAPALPAAPGPAKAQPHADAPASANEHDATAADAEAIPTHGMHGRGGVKYFTLYESRTHYYLIGSYASQTSSHVLAIDRVPPIAREDEDMPRRASSPAPSNDGGTLLSTPHRTHRKTPSTSTSLLANDDARMAMAQPADPHASSVTTMAQAPAGGVGVGAPTHSRMPHGESVSASGHRYLSIDDPIIPELRQHAENKAQPEEHEETDERALRPIAALGTRRGRSVVPSREEHNMSHTPVRRAKEPKPDDADWALGLTADPKAYTPEETEALLESLKERHKGAGGFRQVGRFFGLAGFVRFTAGYYMVLIAQRSTVALIGGHYVYHCDEVQVLPVCHPSTLSALGRSKARDQREAQLLHMFRQVDVSKNFYFSYSYDLTRTLQSNMTGPRAGDDRVVNDKFVWNYKLLQPAFSDCFSRSESPEVALRSAWVLPLVHGFVDQAKLVVLGRVIYVTLIARRSRHYAGARFHKRGVDAKGHVANDVETEQIVNEPNTSSFFAPAKRGTNTLRASPNYTAYVMHRGSIPVYWTQDTSNMSPRPPIEISLTDPYYGAAALHFDALFKDYGAPVIVLNLVKSKERQPRESKLLHAYTECVAYLNQYLPVDRRIKYIAWDMSRASKSRDQDVIGTLERIASETLADTRFFHSGPPPPFRDLSRKTLLLQHGVARINCVDCLDRTNAAQFVLGKAALAHQLHALGLLASPHLDFDSDAVNMLTEMYHDLGDTIALQYGGSALAHTTDTYRKINQWTSHSRDMAEGLKRYYANSFADADKQAAIDLFLGQEDLSQLSLVMQAATQGKPCLCAAPIVHAPAPPDDKSLAEKQAYITAFANSDTGFWDGYYRPNLFTDLQRHHAFKMTAVHQQGNELLSSPKYTSLNQEGAVIETSPQGSTVATPTSGAFPRSIIGGVRRWIRTQPQRDSAHALESTPPSAPAQQSSAPTLEERPNAVETVVLRSLDPVISRQEAHEYQVYLAQFHYSAARRTYRVSDADMQVYDGATGVAAGNAAMYPTHRNGVDPALAAHVGMIDGDTSLTRIHSPAACDVSTSDARVKMYAAWLSLAAVRG
ncbi:phosphatidylinositol-3,5-bisphosphate 5-phosphatase [Malassezia cuniculi]|uniref:Phosphatidylinositol-3,5-bisphosphate 5-phosphatase n=1 Tax=Malassezia cuniculi TaxID=948313 RepID=A0AAF0ETH9_9BASI|nr:phosphatidylinositol-3,5-bisphosphate 5-phosphatase [Malassezia cuniculi]